MKKREKEKERCHLIGLTLKEPNPFYRENRPPTPARARQKEREKEIGKGEKKIILLKKRLADWSNDNGTSCLYRRWLVRQRHYELSQRIIKKRNRLRKTTKKEREREREEEEEKEEEDWRVHG